MKLLIAFLFPFLFSSNNQQQACPTFTPLLATSVTMSLMMPRVTVVSSVGAGAGHMVVLTCLELCWKLTGGVLVRTEWSRVTQCFDISIISYNNQEGSNYHCSNSMEGLKIICFSRTGEHSHPPISPLALSYINWARFLGFNIYIFFDTIAVTLMFSTGCKTENISITVYLLNKEEEYE